MKTFISMVFIALSVLQANVFSHLAEAATEQVTKPEKDVLVIGKVKTQQDNNTIVLERATVAGKKLRIDNFETLTLKMVEGLTIPEDTEVVVVGDVRSDGTIEVKAAKDIKQRRKE